MASQTFNFNQADSTTLPTGLTEAVNDAQTVSNTLRAVTTSAAVFVIASTPLASSDNYAEVDVDFISQPTSGILQAGAVARADSTCSSCYSSFLTKDSSGAYQVVTQKRVGNSNSSLAGGTTTVTPTLPAVLRLEVSGTTLTVKLDGTTVHTLTDASVTAGLYAGARLSKQSDTRAPVLDNLTVSDLSATVPHGSGAGTTAHTGTATGSRVSSGTGSGARAWVGAATGSRTSDGSGSGLTAYTGAATGSRTSAGSGSGTTAYVGTASGTAPSISTHHGAGAGSTAYVGTATGSAVHGGTGAGAFVYTGVATGHSTADQRDVTFLGFNEHTRTVTFNEHTRTVTFNERQRQVTTGGPMKLKRTGREFYDPDPGTEPALTNWEASFDYGTTWVAGELLDDRPKWLVCGPDFPDDGTSSTQIAADVTPLLRAIDSPEVIVRNAPYIYLN